MFGHMKILHALTEMGRTALAAAVPYQGNLDLSTRDTEALKNYVKKEFLVKLLILELASKQQIVDVMLVILYLNLGLKFQQQNLFTWINHEMLMKMNINNVVRDINKQVTYFSTRLIHVYQWLKDLIFLANGVMSDIW